MERTITLGRGYVKPACDCTVAAAVVSYEGTRMNCTFEVMAMINTMGFMILAAATDAATGSDVVSRTLLIAWCGIGASLGGMAAAAMSGSKERYGFVAVFITGVIFGLIGGPWFTRAFCWFISKVVTQCSPDIDSCILISAFSSWFGALVLKPAGPPIARAMVATITSIPWMEVALKKMNIPVQKEDRKDARADELEDMMSRVLEKRDAKAGSTVAPPDQP